MSDETTSGPVFPLRDRIGAALTTACPEHSHCDRMGPAVWEIVRPEIARRDFEIEELQNAAAIAHDIATDRRCLAREAVHRAEQAEAAVARVKALAEDMRTRRSPHGIAVTYAQRIEEAINPPESDLPAVRAFAAKRDPREETTEIHVVESGFVVADDGGWVPGIYPTRQAAERAAWNMRHHGAPNDQPEEAAP